MGHVCVAASVLKANSLLLKGLREIWEGVYHDTRIGFQSERDDTEQFR